METKNNFYLTERYLKKMYKDIVLNEITTFVFYFVFNIMFQHHPHYNILKPAFGVIFMVLAILLIVLGKKRADRVASIHYKVEKNGLAYFDGKTKHYYPWDSFTEVKRNPNLISQIYPYEFHTEEGTFTLHRQLERPDMLIPIILERAGMDPGIFRVRT